jgi:hypothetical protein
VVEHTVVGRDQLVDAVVGLASLHTLLPVDGPCGKLVGPVHPVYPGVYVVLVASPDFQDTRHPVVIRLLYGLHGGLACHGLLSLDRRLVRNVNEAFAKVLDAVDCVLLAPVRRRVRRGPPTNETVVTGHVGPLLRRLHNVVDIHRLVRLEASAR